MKDFKIELDVAEFHHIFKSLVDARYRNENEMKSLVKDEFFADEEILDENRYNQLKQENEEITTLINRIRSDTDKQLKEYYPHLTGLDAE